MSHEQLWAPWRLGYLQGTAAPPLAQPALRWLPGADQQCFLCRSAAEDRDRENFVVARGRETLVMLNRYPYNNGHLLIAPLEHRGALDQLSDAVHLEICDWLSRLTGLIQREMKSEGFNVGLNLGRVAGAGVPGHLHWHLVPRWPGDNNFMPVLAGVRVLPQALDALWTLLHDALATEAAAPETLSAEAGGLS